MSMWEYDEYGNPYPAEERPDYNSSYYYNDESGSSQDYHGSFGGHQSSYGSYSDAHSHGHHHHHEHSHNGPHDHHHGHGGHDDDVSSYYTDPSRSRQQQQQDYSSGHVTNERADEPPAAPVAVPLPPQYSGHDSSGGYDMSAGYEVHVPTVTRSAAPASTGNRENAPDIFTSDSVVNLTLEEIDALATNRRSRAWLVVLYAPWCRFCQAMEGSFERVAQHLERSNIYVGRFRADGDYKEYAKHYLQLESFPTVLFFPKNNASIVKYQSDNREVEALLQFVYAFR